MCLNAQQDGIGVVHEELKWGQIGPVLTSFDIRSKRGQFDLILILLEPLWFHPVDRLNSLKVNQHALITCGGCWGLLKRVFQFGYYGIPNNYWIHFVAIVLTYTVLAIRWAYYCLILEPHWVKDKGTSPGTRTRIRSLMHWLSCMARIWIRLITRPCSRHALSTRSSAALPVSSQCK